MAQIQDFAFIGVKNLLFKDKKTEEVVCELPYLVGFNLSDNQPIEYLRGGFDKAKLLPFKGDRETSVTVTTATSSPDLLKLQFNSEFEEMEVAMDKDANLSVGETAGSFTLPETPAAGEAVTVFAVDNVGKKTKLTLAESDVTKGTYQITGSTITTDTSVKTLRVLYKVKTTSTVLKAKNVDTKVYECTGIVVAQEVGTGDMYACQVDIPSAVVQLNSQLNASNEGGVPENVEFTIDMLADATKDYYYMLTFGDQI